MATGTGIPHRPGPIGLIARLVLGALVLQAAAGSANALADGVSGLPDLDDGLGIAIVVAAWLTPTVYDLGLGTHLGHRWRPIAGAGIAVAAVVGTLSGAADTGLTVGIHLWIILTLGWLGLAFLLAVILRTPGCEMRSLPHLASLIRPGDQTFAACPGPLQPLDEWEARTTGRARPHIPTR